VKWVDAYKPAGAYSKIYKPDQLGIRGQIVAILNQLYERIIYVRYLTCHVSLF